MTPADRAALRDIGVYLPQEKGLCLACGTVMWTYRVKGRDDRYLVGHDGRDGRRCIGSHKTPADLCEVGS